MLPAKIRLGALFRYSVHQNQRFDSISSQVPPHLLLHLFAVFEL